VALSGKLSLGQSGQVTILRFEILRTQHGMPDSRRALAVRRKFLQEVFMGRIIMALSYFVNGMVSGKRQNDG